MSTFIHGIGSVQFIDSSGEFVDLKGLDTTSMEPSGYFNWNHKSDVPGTLVGKILKAKKIFSDKECEDEHQLKFWNKVQVPYLYIMGELLDDYTASAKECAGQLKYSADRPDQRPLLWFSVEGSEIPKTRDGVKIKRSIGRRLAITPDPCNKSCELEIYHEIPKSTVKDDFDFLFKSEANAIEMFKSEKGVKVYEEFLAKKENMEPLQKSIPWSKGKAVGSAVHFSHPEHGVVSIQKQPTGEFHVKHEGKLAGIGGIKGSFTDVKQAGAHAKNYMAGIQNHSVMSPSIANRPSPAMAKKDEAKQDLNKALTAGGSGMSAPSTLTDGAAYAVENVKKIKKTDWNARAKQDYDKWPHRDKFEKFMKARMPHLHDGEIKAIGRTIALQKSIDFEKSLDNLVKKK